MNGRVVAAAAAVLLMLSYNGVSFCQFDTSHAQRADLYVVGYIASGIVRWRDGTGSNSHLT